MYILLFQVTACAYDVSVNWYCIFHEKGGISAYYSYVISPLMYPQNTTYTLFFWCSALYMCSLVQYVLLWPFSISPCLWTIFHNFVCYFPDYTEYMLKKLSCDHYICTVYYNIQKEPKESGQYWPRYSYLLCSLLCTVSTTVWRVGALIRQWRDAAFPFRCVAMSHLAAHCRVLKQLRTWVLFSA